MEENNKGKGIKRVLGSAIGIAKTAVEHGGSVIHKGIEAAKKGVDKFLTAVDETVPYNELVARELAVKLSGYYSGIEPEINNVIISGDWEPGRFNASAKVLNIHSTSSCIQEADLEAEVEITRQFILPMPTPGIEGIDAIQSNFIPAFDTQPKVHRIVLDITNSTNTAEIINSRINEAVKINYPHGRVLGGITPPDITGEFFCKRFIRDTAVLKGRRKEIVRFVKFSIKKVPADKQVDDCLLVRDYEYQNLPPEELFTVDFPGSGGILRILKNEKKFLHKRVIEQLTESEETGFFSLFRKLFFRIKKPFRNIELKDIASETTMTFYVEFDCVAGFSRPYTVSADFVFAQNSAAGRRGEKAITLKFLKHDDFVIKPAAK
jgi:hypothetical protein